jgi:phosphoglycolate phosphatase-like HAD superfamily hydrolase
MRLHGVIFDLDGTLGDTLPACFVAFRRALKDFSAREYADDEISALFGPSEEGMIQRLVPDRWEPCLRAYLAAYQDCLPKYARPIPGMKDALLLLRTRGVTLAVVTGKGPHSAAVTLKHLDLADSFDVVETGSPEGNVKPAAIRKILARWRAAPHQVAYVGDASSDIQAAREAGVIPLGAAWLATTSAQALRAVSPAAIFLTLQDFIRWIETSLGHARR